MQEVRLSTTRQVRTAQRRAPYSPYLQHVSSISSSCCPSLPAACLLLLLLQEAASPTAPAAWTPHLYTVLQHLDRAAAG